MSHPNPEPPMTTRADFLANAAQLMQDESLSPALRVAILRATLQVAPRIPEK